MVVLLVMDYACQVMSPPMRWPLVIWAVAVILTGPDGLVVVAIHNNKMFDFGSAVVVRDQHYHKKSQNHVMFVVWPLTRVWW